MAGLQKIFAESFVSSREEMTKLQFIDEKLFMVIS